jgi:hypothetical protein
VLCPNPEAKYQILKEFLCSFLKYCAFSVMFLFCMRMHRFSNRVFKKINNVRHPKIFILDEVVIPVW